MMKNKKIRIELQYDPVKDKEIIDFIDEYGSTRAGFIKQIIKLYKTQIINSNMEETKDTTKNSTETMNHNSNINKPKKRKLNKLNSFSSDDFDLD